MSSEDFEFTQHWSTDHGPVWSRLLAAHLPEVRKVLEIGSFEGRSTSWLAANVVPAGQAGTIYCLDDWRGAAQRDGVDLRAVEGRFDRNVARVKHLYPQTTIVKRSGALQVTLPTLLAEGHRGTFDFAYVQGGHSAQSVLADLVLAFMLCRPGGIISCDDYIWNRQDDLLEWPKLAIDGFTTCYAEKIRTLFDPIPCRLHVLKLAE